MNGAHGTALPEEPGAFLAAIAEERLSALRKWFLQADALKRTISTSAQYRRANVPIRASQHFSDGAEHGLLLQLDLAGLEACLQPFYDELRVFLISFLSGLPRSRRPSAVVFAGGGSRIHGVRERVVLPALVEVLATEAEARRVLDRLPMNMRVADQAIALGAALVANDLVSVGERLLCNIGIVGGVSAEVAQRLGLKPQGEVQSILVSPVLSRLTPLPAFVRNDSLNLPTHLSADARRVRLAAIVEVDDGSTWLQTWDESLDAATASDRVSWSLSADPDGVLWLTLQPTGGAALRVEGRYARPDGEGAVAVAPGQGRGANGTDLPPRVTPSQLAEAIKAVSGRAGR